RVDDNLLGAAPPDPALRRQKEPRADALPAQVRTHPEVAYLGARAPRPAVDAGGDGPVRVAYEDGEEHAVVDPGALDVEIVEAVLEEGHVRRGRQRLDRGAFRGHAISMGAGRIPGERGPPCASTRSP